MMCHSRFFPLYLLHIYILSWSQVNGDCDDPEIPKDGWRSSLDKHRFQTGEVIHYYCKANYSLVGSPKVICLESGNWDTKPPRCIDPCGTCENEGKCVHQSSGSSRYYCICRPGFRGQKCEIPQCLAPKKVENRRFQVYPPEHGPIYDIGSTLMFYCSNGYMIHGTNHDITCILSSRGTAEWSKAFPICKERKCRNMMNKRMIANGKYTPNKYEYDSGDIIVFSCNAGFQLHGVSVLSCKKSGLWSSFSWPRCLAKNCKNPPGILHGHVVQQSELFPAGTVIGFECRTGDGYYRFGPKHQTCQPNSNGDMIWIPARPVCITRRKYEEYCVRQGKFMTLDPVPGCVSQLHVNGGTTTTRRNTSIDTLTIVTGTAGGLLGFLLVIVAFVIYQRRKLMRRMRRATARRMRSSEDERMLIYCSNDFHFFLPTYDEAVRSRPAEPPPFEAVVNNGEQTTQTNDEGSMSTSNDRTNNTNPENVEVEYEAIENVRVSVDADNASRQTESASQIDTIPSTSPSSNVRAGSVSSQESTEDENQPLV